VVSGLLTPNPYLSDGGSLSEGRCVVVSSKGAAPGSLAGLLLRECQRVATFVILVRNRDRGAVAMVQKGRYIADASSL
jgi:hypothetical protein